MTMTLSKLRRRMITFSFLCAALTGANRAEAEDLILDGASVTLSGAKSYGTVQLTNGARINVAHYDGAESTGWLEIHADSILVDETSSIVADGAGYRGVHNGTGEAPEGSNGGGRGGSCCMDAGGGGGYGGPGGVGGRDGCSGVDGSGGGAIYGTEDGPDIAMGAAGGAAGSADGDDGGYGANGGGAIALYGDRVTVAGTLSAGGNSGSVIHNDSSGGGAGGGILLWAGILEFSGVAQAPGGNGGVVDDYGGGGGGGRIKFFYDVGTVSGSTNVSGGTVGSCSYAKPGLPGTVAEIRIDYDEDGYTSTEGDCAPLDPTIHPGAEEIEDGIDQDCDGTVDENTFAFDDDGDGFNEYEGDCDDADVGAYPGAPEVCGDGVDQDCDGTDLSCLDVDNDGDGYTENENDCDDTDPGINPAAPDICNGIDDDCDGEVDEWLMVSVYSDMDGDGHGDPDTGVTTCDPTTDQVSVGDDCDDGDETVYPEADEVPYDGVDQDCDGEDLVDVDQDGFVADQVEGGDDCDDEDPSIYPGASEVCEDGMDQDCDGFDLPCPVGVTPTPSVEPTPTPPSTGTPEPVATPTPFPGATPTAAPTPTPPADLTPTLEPAWTPTPTPLGTPGPEPTPTPVEDISPTPEPDNPGGCDCNTPGRTPAHRGALGGLALAALSLGTLARRRRRPERP